MKAPCDYNWEIKILVISNLFMVLALGFCIYKIHSMMGQLENITNTATDLFKEVNTQMSQMRAYWGELSDKYETTGRSFKDMQWRDIMNKVLEK